MKKLLPACAFVLASIQALPAAAAEFLFIRHAESLANAGTSTTVDQIYNPTLTALGFQQADALATTLSGLNITAIYTSAYQRTQLTIAPTATAFGLTPTADARTNEWYFGDATSLSDLQNAGISSVVGQWVQGNLNAKTSLPNGESLNELVTRVLPAWQEIIAAHKNDDGVVVIVGHSLETGFVMPYLANNVSLSFAVQHSLTNTGIINVKLDANGTPYVTNWQGTQVAPVPLPAGLPLMLSGLSVLGGAGIARRHRQ